MTPGFDQLPGTVGGDAAAGGDGQGAAPPTPAPEAPPVAPPTAGGDGQGAAPPAPAPEAASVVVRAPVTKERVLECLESAGFWVKALPKYADSQQFWADVCGIVAGLVSAVMGLAIWPVLTGVDQSGITELTPGAWLFSGAALLAASIALVPRILNFGEMAGQARELTSRYGSVLGALEDVAWADRFDPIAARPAVDEFESTKVKKDGLRRLPNKEKMLEKWAKERRVTAETTAASAEAERLAARKEEELNRQLAAAADARRQRVEAELAAFQAAEQARRQGLPPPP
jgi:hypothetical protein